MKYFYSCLLVIISISVFAQNNENESPYTDFDFWVGEWDLEWKDPDGNIGTGKNIIHKTLDGKVIQENFEGLTGQYKGFTGKSWSVYDVSRENWYQTWVDNQGAYLDFYAMFEGDKKMFVRDIETPDGSMITQRMVFYEITDSSFMWDWESSTDGGKTWNLNWQISYTRR